MEIIQLRYLVAAAQEFSFAKAAEACFTTRQSVSRSIKELEHELGATLFERKGNAMMLTSAGEIAVEQAKSALETIDNLKILLASPPPVQQIKIATSTNLMAGIPVDITTLIDESLQGQRFFEMGCKECYEQVCARSIDAAFISCMEQRFPDCCKEEIGYSAAYLLVDCDSPLARKSYYTISDLKDLSLVLMEDPSFQYAPLIEMLDTFNYNHEKISIVESTSSMLHIIKRFPAVAIVSENFASRPPRGTATIPIIEPKLNWHFYLVYRPDPNTYYGINNLIRCLKTKMQGKSTLDIGDSEI